MKIQHQSQRSANSLQPFSVCTLVGTEAVRMEGDEVVGRWKAAPLTEFYGLRGRLLVEDFVNWGETPDEIVRFTAIYAPLDFRETPGVPDGALPTGGNEFRFRLDSWRKAQNSMRLHWEVFTQHPEIASSKLQAENGEWIRLEGQRVTYETHTLNKFLGLELFTVSPQRIRKCLRPDCETPYFIARHLKQAYCSTPCAQWAQTQWKKQWWKAHGKQWLKGRRAKSRKRR